ncbi:MAG: hypothetical protein VW338_16085 [Rhodospirillaceae bacterium]
MSRKYSVIEWRDPPLQAAGMRVGQCCARDLIGVDLVARDGKAFAHGHMSLTNAIAFCDDLQAAIAELVGRPPRVH